MSHHVNSDYYPIHHLLLVCSGGHRSRQRTSGADFNKHQKAGGEGEGLRGGVRPACVVHRVRRGSRSSTASQKEVEEEESGSDELPGYSEHTV